MVTALTLFAQLATPAQATYVFDFKLVRLSTSDLKAMKIELPQESRLVHQLRFNQDVVNAHLNRIKKEQFACSPSLITPEGRVAEIFLGETTRYVESIDENDKGITVKTAEAKTGVTFSVRAVPQADALVRVNLRLQAQSLTGFVPNGRGQLPQTTDSLADIPLSMKLGETIAVTWFSHGRNRNIAEREVLFMTLRRP